MKILGVLFYCLRKHINTKHKLNDEEVNIIIHNESTDKELKKAKRQIKELEDKGKNLALGKAKADCEVNQLRTETDSLSNILSLRPSIDNHLPVKQTKKKKNNLLSLGGRPTPLFLLVSIWKHAGLDFLVFS